MHSYTNGFGGSIVFNSVTLDVDSWTLSVNGEAVDTTNTGDAGWESNILGAKSWEGSCKTYYDTTVLPTTAFTAGMRATITLPVGSTVHNYSGTCQITQVSIENPVKGAVTFNFNFKGSGALTYAT